MSRQQMQFQLAYSTPDTNAKCKSCKESVNDKELMVGVKSDSMFDPMWYHSSCFWTRCWYRKQMTRHLDNYTELPGFSSLTPQDKESFKEALTLNASESDAVGLKRKSESDDTAADLSNKKIKPDAVQLPKLPSSAAEFISKSSSNADSRFHDTRPVVQEVTFADGKSVVVNQKSGDPEICITSPGQVRGTSFAMTAQQWRKLTSVFDDVISSVASVNDTGDQVIPLGTNLQVRVSQEANGQCIIVLGVAKETDGTAVNQRSDNVTFTPAQWNDFKARASEVDAAIVRVAS